MPEVTIIEAFRNDGAARQYLEAAFDSGALPPDLLLPPRKWVQAIYLADGGRLKIRADHLAHILNIPYDVAKDAVKHLAKMNGKEVKATVARKATKQP
ncbi:MAG: hypothetical protein JSS04_18680 [Proteobacteria bacterium]|nr:hypothetical protein [Pseudomonadota bacterium]